MRIYRFWYIRKWTVWVGARYHKIIISQPFLIVQLWFFACTNIFSKCEYLVLLLLPLKWFYYKFFNISPKHPSVTKKNPKFWHFPAVITPSKFGNASLDHLQMKMGCSVTCHEYHKFKNGLQIWHNPSGKTCAGKGFLWKSGNLILWNVHRIFTAINAVCWMAWVIAIKYIYWNPRNDSCTPWYVSCTSWPVSCTSWPGSWVNTGPFPWHIGLFTGPVLMEILMFRPCRELLQNSAVLFCN